jgi:quinoprotein glucose dehydrogenase
VIVFAVLALAALAAQQKYEPYVAPASKDGEAAIARFQVPPGFEVKLWAAEPQLANVVSMCIDEKGDVYVAEDFRIKSGVDDIRDHMDWLDDDVACRKVEDRVAYLRKRLGDKFADYSKDSERVRWISDTDGDGRADKDTVFAEGFNNPAAGVGAGLLAWKGKVYYTCIPDLWSLADTNGDHVADERKVLSTGYGIRFALMGHDLHGLVIGPDGKLYFSCGDRGFSAPLSDGTRLNNQFCGAVLRCNLDGSDLEVFATGLRNPQELVFDDYGELFTVDNNSDGGDKARLVHVIEGMDAGWRQSYQWLDSPNLRGPWNDEKLWYPHFDGQAAYIVPPLANICDGPSGLAYNPGIALTPEWRNHFFICDFRGTPADSGIQTFTLKPKGSSFELDEFKHFIWGTLATDCTFGPDGSLYWSDWVEGWGKTGKGRIYRLTTPLSSRAAELAQSLARVPKELDDRKLATYLSHEDRRVRTEAQFELAARKSSGALVEVAKDSGRPRVARLHAVWALGMFGSRAVEQLTEVDDPIVLAAVIRVFGEIHHRGQWLPNIASNQAPVLAALDHPSPIVQREAALAISRGMSDLDREFENLHARIYAKLSETGESDPALRHALIAALAHFEPEGKVTYSNFEPRGRETNYEYHLSDARKLASVDARIGVVVSLRRRQDASIAEFLSDPEERVVVEAARATYDVPIDAAMPALANLIESKELKGTALVRRVINANFRLGGVPRAIALARFATRGDQDELLRWEAIDLLSKWAEPPGRDGLTGEWWPIAKREADFLPGLVREMRERGIETAPTKVLVAWIKLAEQCGARDQAVDLIAWGSDAKRDLKVRVAALKAAQTLSPKDLEPALSSLVLDAESKVRATALSAIQLLTPAKAMPLLEQAALQGSRDERRVAYAALAKIDDPRADEMFARELAKLRAGFVPSEVALDLVEGAEQRKSDKVKQALEALLAPRKVDDKLAPFADCLYGGDRERGKKIFREKAETTCLRCHKVEWGEGGQVGPDLNGVGKRLSRLEIMESIADPNRRIVRGYDAIVLTLDNDQHVAGIVVEETPDKVKVRTAQDELVEVDAKSIASRRPDLSAMPQDVSKFLSRDDMRDVIEFLANL